MEAEEWEEGVLECEECGAPVAEGADRVFAFAERSVICFECAILRGGEYDAIQERWIVHPSIEDLERRATEE